MSKFNRDINLIIIHCSATKEGMRIATELGYLMSTAARDLTKIERKKIINSPMNRINRVARFTPVMLNQWKKNDNNSIIVYSPGWFFVLQLINFQSKYFAKYWMKYVLYIIVKMKKIYV